MIMNTGTMPLANGYWIPGEELSDIFMKDVA